MLLQHPKHIKIVRDITSQKSIDYLLARGWVKIGEALGVPQIHETDDLDASADVRDVRTSKTRRGKS